MPAEVTLDTSALEAGARRLLAGLERAGPRVGMEEASATARRIRERVPVRTGALAGTVSAVPVTDGAAVTYGGTLPYAGYIERRTDAVAEGISGAEQSFYQSMSSAAAAEVRNL